MFECYVVLFYAVTVEITMSKTFHTVFKLMQLCFLKPMVS